MVKKDIRMILYNFQYLPLFLQSTTTIILIPNQLKTKNFEFVLFMNFNFLKYSNIKTQQKYNKTLPLFYLLDFITQTKILFSHSTYEIFSKTENNPSYL